ncbi:MAG TPA: bifunctional 4-hydroxy-2-oxoglutarate aldolase/2-dehydro-3-deoxy-phosphogluconate aldolase [Cyclobacteriaceae bacterium]|nr:bifunctional 4-hydroxy-2-oxoglutarate aldolase/2-dehydro-3-deoxy-phosphogluconate aldolase [Cyclobacteriaceae bacterium]HRJ83196.1 bifunctional 4-hydroxy-2-oxoglutarate aldolase/2-dehydro-3-deoxy-phosphogluconate aldolase [Cyclobacteriaceae bacterium]
MLNYTPDSIVAVMRSSGMIPVFYHADIEVAKNVLDACYRGGVRVFEFTNRGGNAFDVFKALLRHVEQYPDLLLGIGTIMDGATAKKFIDAGAHFIVSPILKAEMASVCQVHNKLWIPGCATLTEIVTAKDLGAQVIKLFPGSVLGPDFVSAVMPVVPGLQLMPTGGVEPTEESLSAWFKAGVVCVGMGSKLMVKKADGSFDLTGIETQSRNALKLISKYRK